MFRRVLFSFSVFQRVFSESDSIFNFHVFFPSEKTARKFKNCQQSESNRVSWSKKNYAGQHFECADTGPFHYFQDEQRVEWTNGKIQIIKYNKEYTA